MLLLELLLIFNFGSVSEFYYNCAAHQTADLFATSMDVSKCLASSIATAVLRALLQNSILRSLHSHPEKWGSCSPCFGCGILEIHPKFHSRYQTPQIWCGFHCPASRSSAVLDPILTNRAPGYGDASSSDKFSAYVWLYEEEYKNKIREPEEYRRCMQKPWNYLLFRHTVRVDGSRWRRMWAGEEIFVCLCQRRSCSLSLANIVFLIPELVDLVPPSHLCLVSFSIVS